MTNQRRTLCIILHYGDESDTWNCVDSIIGKDRLDIIIVDNDPAQQIKVPENLNHSVKIFKTGGALGFAHANNMAVRECRNEFHDLVFLLNNDTVVLDNAIDRMHRLIEGKNVGAVGPCMPYLSRPDKIWACGGYIRKFFISVNGFNEIQHPEPYEVDYLPGAAILCKLDVWDQVGGLSEKYFLAYEEAEFAMEIRKLDLHIVVDPKARILHKVGISSNRQNGYLYNTIRNRIKFGKYLWGKYSGPSLAAFMALISMRKRKFGLSIWFRAIIDEARNASLDWDAIKKIEHDFGV